MGATGLGTRDIIGTFFQRLEAYMGSSWVELISMLFESDQASETYKWLGMVPAMREWLGGRHAHGFRENGITIINKTFEGTLQIPVDWIRRDKTQQIDIRVGELAVRAVEHWAKLLSTFISNGTGSTSGLCYDGQYFFDDDHEEGSSGVQKNLLTNTEVAALDVTTTTAPTAKEAVAAILGVIGYMLGFKDDQGEPMNANAKEFLVMTSVTLWPYLCPAIANKVIDSGETNTIASIEADGFRIRLAANPRLTYTTQFVVFRTDGQAKPLIRQEEEETSMTALVEGSDHEFKENEHLYGAKAIRNVGYGYWQHAAHATLS